MSVGRRGPVGPASSHHPLHQSAAKRKASELSGPSDPLEPVARRPAPAPVGEKAASGARHLGSFEGAATYATVPAASATPQQPGGPLKPTAKGLIPTKPTVPTEAAPQRTTDCVSGSISGMQVDTTTSAHAANACLPTGERPNKTHIFISGVGDTRPFLA